MEQQRHFYMFKLMKRMKSAYSFSFLLFSSSLVLLILHLIKSYSMISLVSVMKFNIDRNHVFLICNGILVILVKSCFSLSSSSSSQDSNSSYNSSNAVQNDQSLPKLTVSSDQGRQEETSAVTSEQKVTTDVKLAHFSTVDDHVHVHVQEEKLVVSECEVHVNYNDDGNDHHQEDDHDDDEGEDAEELNERCEEFIRRMKQGIISESRKDLGLARFS